MANDITQRKQTQAQLRATQELFEKFMYYSPTAAYIKDAQGHYRFVNHFTEQTWQRSLAQWRGKTDFDLFSVEVAQAIRDHDSQVLAEGKTLQIQEITENADGIHHWLSLKFPIESSTGETLLAGMSLDISDRVRAENALRESEVRLRRLVDADIIGVFFADFSGRISEANHAFLDMVGYTQEDLATGQLRWDVMTPPEYQALDAEIIANVRQRGVSSPVEKEYIRKDGTRVPVLLGVALLLGSSHENYCVCYALDISDRKQAQVEIERQAQQQTAIAQIGQKALADRELNVLFQQTTELVATVLGVEYCKVLKLLESGEAMRLEAGVGWHSGLVGTATVGTDLDSQAGYTLLWDHPVVVEDLRQETRFSGPPLLCDHGVISGMSVVIRDQDGIYGILGAHTTQKQDFSEDEVNFLQAIANILSIAIARHQTEQAVHELNQTLEAKVTERTQQLEEINEELKDFTYSVSHDLRAPLRAIQGFATALEEDYADQLDDLARDYTRRLTGAAYRLDRLIQDLLAYSRLSRTDLRLKAVDLSSVVEEAQANLGTEIAQKEAEVTVLKPLGDIIGNHVVLVQIVTNLLHNGLKFTKASVRPQIKIWSESQNEVLRLYIEDNGIGIHPEHQERIFDVFERLHGVDTYSGTGIGLAIVRKGMERLGGRVGVESSPSQGSRFWIEGKQCPQSLSNHD
jgi:PAS domain S-box-containing protein